jgi:hypothetical protein
MNCKQRRFVSKFLVLRARWRMMSRILRYRHLEEQRKRST